jgi:hypothetical protein
MKRNGWPRNAKHSIRKWAAFRTRENWRRVALDDDVLTGCGANLRARTGSATLTAVDVEDMAGDE